MGGVFSALAVGASGAIGGLGNVASGAIGGLGNVASGAIEGLGNVAGGAGGLGNVAGGAGGLGNVAGGAIEEKIYSLFGDEKKDSIGGAAPKIGTHPGIGVLSGAARGYLDGDQAGTLQGAAGGAIGVLARDVASRLGKDSKALSAIKTIIGAGGL